MSTKLEKLLSQLDDNVWHSADEIVNVLEISQGRCEQIMKLLAETDLIYYNPATNQVKLNQEWKALYMNRKGNSETTTQDENTAVGTIIIPPQKTLIIQCTRITNLTDINLELEVRIDKKISEIAINKLK